MDLRSYCEADEETCRSWFPSEGADPFIDRKWLEAASRKAGYEPERHSLFVGWNDGERVSIVSISRVPGEDRAGVALLIAPHVRRQGMARATMQAVRDLFSDVDEFVAWVDPKNVPSVKLLESLGLARGPHVDERDLFVWRRDGTPIPPDWQPPKLR